MILNPLKWSLPIKLIFVILGVVLVGDHLSLETQRFFYAVSLTLKECLVFVLPAIIFSYIATCLLSFKKGLSALAFISLLLALAWVSNFASTLIAFGAGSAFASNVSTSKELASEASRVLVPLWDFTLIEWIKPNYALLSGLIVGVVFSLYRVPLVERTCNKLKNLSTFFLSRMFIPVVPLFILGSVIKFQYDGVLNKLLTSVLPIFLFTVLTMGLYVLFLYFVAAGFNVKRCYRYVKNALPSGIAGFSTMSSAAAMPLTLQGAEVNTGNPNMARAVIPATVNIHMIGNCITVPLLALSILQAFGMPFPSIDQYFVFGAKVAIYQFSVAAVPGGGIFVMLPLLEQYLGFTTEMIALITTIYMMFDPPLTGSNIMGNGAFSIFLNKLMTKLGIVGGE